MKKFVITAAAAFISALSFAHTWQIDVVPEGVSSYTQTEYDVTTKFGEYYRTVTGKYVHVFASGLETEISSFNTKDALTDRTVLKYDTGRNLVSKVTTDDKGTVLARWEFEYFSDGKLKSETEYNISDVLTTKIIYKYEEKKITESNYNRDGKLLCRTISTLNDAGKPVEEILYYADGTVAETRKFSYNDNGLVSTEEVYNDRDALVMKFVCKYDASSKLVEAQTYDGEGTLKERVIYKNDSKGNPSRISFYEIAEKFGTTSSELKVVYDYSYKNSSSGSASSSTAGSSSSSYSSNNDK